MYSLSEVESRLLEVMDEAGLSPAPGQSLEISDNKFIRYQLAGDKRGKKNGAYLLHLDERPAGYIQNWKTKASRSPLRVRRLFPRRKLNASVSR